MKSQKRNKKITEYSFGYCDAFGHTVRDGRCAVCKKGIEACLGNLKGEKEQK